VNRVLLLLIALSLLLTACSAEPAVGVTLSNKLQTGIVQVDLGAPATAFSVGFDRRLEPKEDVRMYAPLLTYLERATGLSFHLHVTSRDGNVVDEIGSGKVDFAIVGTLSYLQASERWGAKALVRGLNSDGEPTYRSAIVTRPDGTIHTLSDLRGRSLAFGAPNSTQGNLIPRMLLAEEGISLSDLRSYEYTNSHAATASAVVNGRYDAGGLQDTLAMTLQRQGLVRVIALSRPFPSSGVMVSSRVPEQVVESVRKALLEFDPTGRDAAGLYHWERSEMPRGFAPAKDEDYAELREWALSFGLLAR
jgi:phosphonate transport system substrate-binding protein